MSASFALASAAGAGFLSIAVGAVEGMLAILAVGSVALAVWRAGTDFDDLVERSVLAGLGVLAAFAAVALHAACRGAGL